MPNRRRRKAGETYMCTVRTTTDRSGGTGVYNFAGMTAFSATFGGREAAVMLEAGITHD